jgi:type I restriction enzyme S subunit
MNAERLLEHYYRVADALDAIARLRRFILDLAVRGKLVPQHHGDEPAHELLLRIGRKKERLAKAGEIRQGKPLPSVDKDAEFEVPATWCWTRLGMITSYIQRGKSPKYTILDGSLVVSQKCVQWAGFNLDVAKQITLSSLADYENARFLRDGDLLWNSTGTGTIGRVIRLVEPPEKLVCDSHVTVVRCLEVDPEYIRIWLRSDHVYAFIEDRATGSTNQVELTAQMAVNQVVPLPPLAEQHRIVTKVDELMALCDRLEAARAEREATRDRLTKASLSRLNNPDPDPAAFAGHASFALRNLPALTARPDQIKHLRQTILNLAVRGKLVPQDLNDEPASELLKRITKKKDCARRGTVTIDPNAELYPLPRIWKWASLDELITAGPQNGISPKPTTRPDAPKAITLTATTAGSFDSAHFKRVEVKIPEDSDFWLTDGDLLFQRGNTRDYVGIAAIYNGPSKTFLFPDLIMRVRVSDLISLRFVHLASISPPARTYFSKNASGAQATMPKINQTTLVSLPIPLPPLAEQYRIVAKVDALMALCDRLEASLTSASDTRRRLLDALLAEVLAPSDVRRLEAAE